jgi:hypothetical protein
MWNDVLLDESWHVMTWLNVDVHTLHVKRIILNNF